jgi:hypothetical protein
MFGPDLFAEREVNERAELYETVERLRGLRSLDMVKGFPMR